MAIQCIAQSVEAEAVGQLAWFCAPPGFEPVIKPGAQLLVEEVNGFRGEGFYLQQSTQGATLVMLRQADPSVTHLVRSQFVNL